jgi:YHS domain-containing protein
MDTLKDSLDEFAAAIQSRIAAADGAPKWTGASVQAYMEQFAPRRQRFEGIAAHLVADVIRPRMLRLASFFNTARSDRVQLPDRCVLSLGYCERFPVNVKLQFAIEHDERVEHVCIHYELSIMPTFQKFTAHENLTLPLEKIDDFIVAQWVEARILEFVESYLQIDRGPPDTVTDPVCAMRINRSAAAAQENYRGHTYFFCTDECHRQFVANPTHYILFRPSG